MDELRSLRRLRAGGIVAAAFVGVMLLARAGLPILAANLLHVPALLFAFRGTRGSGSDE